MLPIILGGIALAAAGFGAKKGYDGYENSTKADDIKDRAEAKYNNKKNVFDKSAKDMQEQLDELGQKELEISSQFDEFSNFADKLIDIINQQGTLSKIKVSIPQYKLDAIKEISTSAVAVLGTTAVAGGVGAGAAFAVYGGVMAVGAASTGTAISALSGAAAYNATMAAIGGGALSAGGLGMAGGAAILGATVAAPIIAIAGWAYAEHAEKKLQQAEKYKNEVAKAISKMDISMAKHQEIAKYISKIKEELERIYALFLPHFEWLRAIFLDIEKYGEKVIDSLSDEIELCIGNGYAIASILTDIMTTPLFKFKKDADGQIIEQDGVPVLLEDENGLQVINKGSLDEILVKADEGITPFEK